jgi:hypothetical protein
MKENIPCAMRTSDQWLKLMAPDVPWQECYTHVNMAAVNILEALKPEEDISSTALLDLLYPIKHVPAKDVKAAQAARTRMFRALMATPKEGMIMEGYCTQGPPTSYSRFGRKVRRWSWHDYREVTNP